MNKLEINRYRESVGSIFEIKCVACSSCFFWIEECKDKAVSNVQGKLTVLKTWKRIFIYNLDKIEASLCFAVSVRGGNCVLIPAAFHSLQRGGSKQTATEKSIGIWRRFIMPTRKSSASGRAAQREHVANACKHRRRESNWHLTCVWSFGNYSEFHTCTLYFVGWPGGSFKFTIMIQF